MHIRELHHLIDQEQTTQADAQSICCLTAADDDPTILAKALTLLDDTRMLLFLLRDATGKCQISQDLRKELLRVEFTVDQFLTEWGIDPEEMKDPE